MFLRSSLVILTAQHLLISLIAAFIGVSLGILATRRFGRDFLPLIRDASSLAQTVPPAAVLALAIPFLGFGFEPVLLALVLYGILPVLNNTLAGIEGVPPAVLEAARGIGMSPVGAPIAAGLIRDNPAWMFQSAAASALTALLLKGVERHLGFEGIPDGGV